MKQSDELKVFISTRESVCGECHENLGRGAWITLNHEKGALCLSCADMEHLEFLSPGDRALTLRAKKYSSLYAVVLKWSRARKRYERQGLLVEEEAIIRAEKECLEDADARERRRVREAERREYADEQYISSFAEKIRQLYPGCPPGTEKIIAERACKKYRGRVGRSSAAKSLGEKAIALAVAAHIRHTETDYDALLIKGSAMHVWQCWTTCGIRFGSGNKSNEEEGSGQSLFSSSLRFSGTESARRPKNVYPSRHPLSLYLPISRTSQTFQTFQTSPTSPPIDKPPPRSTRSTTTCFL